jgi:hypothetical protein
VDDDWKRRVQAEKSQLDVPGSGGRRRAEEPHEHAAEESLFVSFISTLGFWTLDRKLKRYGVNRPTE